MSLKTRVEGYVGSITDTDLLTDILTASTKYIMDILPNDLFEQFSSTVTVASGGYGIQAYKLLSASKGGYPARKVDASSKTALSDYNSIYYATTTDPCHYIENGSIYILPGGGTVTVVSYPTVDGSQVFIYGLPQGLDEAVIILSAMKELNYKANSYVDALNSYSMDSVVAPTVPSAPSFTYTDATLGTYVSTLVGDFGTTPTYVPPVNTVDFTNAGTDITNDDVEIAQVELQKQGQIISKYSNDIQSNSAKFQQELSTYQSVVQKRIADAQMAQQLILQYASDTKDLNLQNEAQVLAEQVQEYQSILGKYQGETQSYATEVGYKIQKFLTRSSNLTTQHAGVLQQMQMLEKQLMLILGKYIGVSDGK